MKIFSITFTLLIIFLLPYSSYSQSCTLTDNTLNTQAEVDAFPTLYPGCKVILNSLIIDGNDITDLTPLNGITEVQGLFGLKIKNNDILTTLAGLDSLTKIGRSIQMTNNPELIDISALSNITTIGRDLLILNNSKLPNLDGFSSLSSIDDIRIETNFLLNDISGLSALTSISGTLSIKDADQLTDLSDLANVTSIGNSLFIWGNDMLTSITGLNQITTVPGIFDIARNNVLTDITAFANLTSVGNDLRIHFNAALGSLAGLQNVNSIAGSLTIRDNSMLTDISQLSNLTTINLNLQIIKNPMLSSLAGLQNITSIGKNLELTNNDALTDFQNLNAVTSVGQNLLIESNDALTSLNGLNALADVTGFTRIRYNPQLSSFSGLDALQSIHDGLTIDGCSKLSDLSHLSNLTVNRFFTISHCPKLTTLSGLDNIDTSYLDGVTLFDNMLLATCAVPSVCDFIAGGGSLTLSSNKAGCNTVAEIHNDCLSLPVELSYFDVKNKGRKHLLTWQTESENNNDYFQIEHSVDGNSFLPIGKINGAGNSVSPIEYSFVNNNPTNGTNYYRLKQTDFDGTYEYSNIVAIELINDGLMLYPNPVVNTLFIELTKVDNIEYQIFDVSGKEIKTGVLSALKNQIDFENYSRGLYVIKFGNQILKFTK